MNYAKLSRFMFSINLLIFGLMHTPVIANPTDGYECYDGKKVCREQSTSMPLKVLPRAFAGLYEKPNGTKKFLAKPLKAFRPLYVFARQDIDTSDPDNPKGWYKVRESIKKPLGWMPAKDVIEWKQALIVAYTHPGEGDEKRNPVLMFDQLPALKKLISEFDRETEAQKAYDSLNKDPKDRYPSLVLTESKRFVDINESFYFLPIVNFEMLDLDGEDARYLQVAAAIPESTAAKHDIELRGDNNTTLDNPEIQREVLNEQASPEALKKMEIDIVFVMDLTGSMEPYLRMTIESVQDIARLVTMEVKEKVNFGFIGYRDNPSVVRGMEFASKDFTQAGFVNADNFVDLVEGVKVASVGSKDFQEEVFAGIETGLAAQWSSNNSLRIMVLVGDASSHEPGHPQNTTGKDEHVLRQAADDAQIHIMAIHLRNQVRHPEIIADLPRAKKQFATLSKVSGSDESALLEIDTDKEEHFEVAVKTAATMITEVIEQTSTGNMPSVQTIATSATPITGTTGDPSSAKIADQAKQAMQMLIEAALVEYKGKEAVPPKDVIAWAIDRDMVDPAIPALEVRILLDKKQLSSLVQVVDDIIKSMKRAEVTQQQFFEALQGVAAASMKDPSKIGKAKTLKETDLLPKFLESLPYRSEIASLTDERFASWTTQKRTDFAQRLEAKLALYQTINESVDKWVVLDESEPNNKVYPLHIDLLP